MHGKDVAHADKCRCIHCSKVLLDATLGKWDENEVPFPKSPDATIYVKAHWRKGKQARAVRRLTKAYFRTKVFKMRIPR